MGHGSSTFLPLAIVLLIVLRRAGRAQKVRTNRMWVTPLLSLAGIVSTMGQEPMPGVAAIAIFALAAALGGAAGWFRAVHVELTRDAATGEISSKATQIGTILIVVFLLVRVGLDYLVNGKLGFAPPRLGAVAAKHGADLFRLADAALIFTTAMMLGQRIEILRRARLLMRSAESPAVRAS
jgi:hypothetical protein